MANIVYIDAQVQDENIIRALKEYYRKIEQLKDSGEIEGFENLEAITEQSRLNELLVGKPEKFEREIQKYGLDGIGIWTEWSDKKAVGAFYISELHRELMNYERKTSRDKSAWYRVISIYGDNLSVLTIPDDKNKK